MVSTTSGTTGFNLDVDEIIEEAYTYIGEGYVTGVDSEKARRKLNLILIELQNHNIPLNKLEADSFTTTASTATYTLDADVVDVLELNVESGDLQISCTRIGRQDYQQIPNKSETNTRPTQFVTDRQEDAVRVTFWPVPTEELTVTMLVSKRIEDVTASYQKLDLSYRYLPLLTKWLAYSIACSIPDYPEDRLMRLERTYQAVAPSTFEEDRERTDLRIVPSIPKGR